ncbi:MAG: hypothetical protein ACC652_00885 [Acidimicrobiales bacterium]
MDTKPTTDEGYRIMAYNFQDLDREWMSLCRSTAARRAIRCWQNEPALGWATTLDDFCGLQSGPQTDARLLALIRLAANDEMAARTILQAMLPGLRSIARTRGHGFSAVDVDAQLMALCWERIVTYPHERRLRAVASNILLDTRRGFVRWVIASKPQARQGDELAIANTGEAGSAVEAGAVATIDLHDGQVRALQFVQRAVTDGVLTQRTADTITRTRVGGERLILVAESLGISYVAARARRSRGERRLAACYSYPLAC